MREFGRLAVMAAAVGGVAVAGVARAASITATLDNVSPAQIVGITYNNQYLGNAYAGALNWHGQASNDHGLNGNFTTFCIDLTQDVYLGGTYTFEVVGADLAPNPLPPTAPVGATGMGAANLQYLENLYALHYGDIDSSNVGAAAFQIAIWDILFNTEATPLVISADSATLALASQFAADAKGSGALNFGFQMWALAHPTAQDQLFIGPPTTPESGPPTVVPTPAAAIGALPLLGGLAMFQRQRRRNGL